MKHLTAILLAFIIICILPGCGSNIKPQEKISSEFKCDFTLEFQGTEYGGTAEFSNSTRFTLSSPENVCGFSIIINGEQFTAQYSDITYTGKISEIPSGNILTSLIDILSSAENEQCEFKSDNDGYYTEGKADIGGYRLYYRADGFPQRLIFTDTETTLEFENMSYAFE